MLQYGVIVVTAILLFIEGGLVKIQIIADGQPVRNAAVEWVEGACGDYPDEITATDDSGYTELYVDRGDKLCVSLEWTDALGRTYSGEMRIDEPDEYTLDLRQTSYTQFLPIVET